MKRKTINWDRVVIIGLLSVIFVMSGVIWELANDKQRHLKTINEGCPYSDGGYCVPEITAKTREILKNELKNKPLPPHYGTTVVCTNGICRQETDGE